MPNPLVHEKLVLQHRLQLATVAGHTDPQWRRSGTQLTYSATSAHGHGRPAFAIEAAMAGAQAPATRAIWHFSNVFYHYKLIAEDIHEIQYEYLHMIV